MWLRCFFVILAHAETRIIIRLGKLGCTSDIESDIISVKTSTRSVANVKKDVDDYLQEGIYGAKETNPAERKQYLGTLRERIVFVLTKGQVMKAEGLSVLEQKMKDHPNTKLLLNGSITFRYFKPYRQLATKHHMLYTTVNNREARSDYGLVLTHDHAVDHPDEAIFLQEEVHPAKQEDHKKASFWSKLFGLNK